MNGVGNIYLVADNNNPRIFSSSMDIPSEDTTRRASTARGRRTIFKTKERSGNAVMARVLRDEMRRTANNSQRPTALTAVTTTARACSAYKRPSIGRHNIYETGHAVPALVADGDFVDCLSRGLCRLVYQGTCTVGKGKGMGMGLGMESLLSSLPSDGMMSDV